MVYKWTFLATLVELTGTVLPGVSLDSFDLEVDQNYQYLTDILYGSGALSSQAEGWVGKVHCETYPILPNSPPSANYFAPWALPDHQPDDPLAGQVWDFSVTPPVTRTLQSGDRVRVRGQLRIENG